MQYSYIRGRLTWDRKEPLGNRCRDCREPLPRQNWKDLYPLAGGLGAIFFGAAGFFSLLWGDGAAGIV